MFLSVAAFDPKPGRGLTFCPGSETQTGLLPFQTKYLLTNFICGKLPVLLAESHLLRSSSQCSR